PPAESAGRQKKLLLFLAAVGLVAASLFLYRGFSTGFLAGRTRWPRSIMTTPGALEARNLNVLLITLDTTRADHLGCYGYPRARTPRIDGLAGEGFLFKNAAAQVPLTLPSHASILTGTYPFHHAVRDNGGFYLEPGQLTLAEVLKREGWATSAFIGAFVLDSRWGIDQGFDHYHDDFDFSKYKTVSLDSVQRPGGEVVRAFLDWLAANGRKKFFSWIHLYDPHSPYEPPEPYRTQFAGGPASLYDGEIAYVDDLVGRVVDELKAKGLYENTVIVITGDHGESLGEHQESYHGFFVYDATTSVPLVIRVPSARVRGKTIEPQVESVDIMPSLLDLVGVSVPPGVQGRSFLPLMAGRGGGAGKPAYSETYYPRYHYGWSEIKSLRTPRYRYILAPTPELYDLARDPGETVNIYGRDPDAGKRLEKDLRARLGKMSAEGVEARGPRQLDGEAREKLMALGYVGGFTSSAKLARTGRLSDPKDKIILYNKIKRAEDASIAREYDDALGLLDEVVAQDPEIMEARQVRARIYLALDRPEEALAECREALKVDEGYEAAVLTMAQAYKMLKRYDEAVAGFVRARELDPRDPNPFVSLGEIYCATRRFDEAIANLAAAVELDPDHSAQAHNLLGTVYLEKGMFDEARKEIGRALEIRPRLADAHFNLGWLNEARKDLPKAIEEYREEIEIHPDSYPAHFNLAMIFSRTGDYRGAAAEFKAVIRSEKTFARGYLFLARTYLDLKEDYGEAISLARAGLELEPESESAPLGHYILAELYNRLGRRAECAAELEKGRVLEAKLKKGKS
ncbi:MAG: sulfatase-like hydrolase/transferase, partial [Acidobacteriota bacterium]